MAPLTSPRPRPSRVRVLAAGLAAGALLAGATGGGLWYRAANTVPSLHARLDLGGADHVRVGEPVTIRFDRVPDLARVEVTASPAAELTVERRQDRLVVHPATAWKPDTSYTLTLSDVPQAGHRGPALRHFSAPFRSQPGVGVAAFRVDGSVVTGTPVTISPRSLLSITFTGPMRTEQTVVQVDGNPAAASLTWQPDATTVAVAVPGALPYTPFSLQVPSGTSAAGDPVTDPASLAFSMVPLLPAGAQSGVGPGFPAQAPIIIQLENSDASRPQSGVQAADMVFEAIAEGGITRLATVYFNTPPSLVGPVRSCRTFNLYLGFGFGAETLCSGASNGTINLVFDGNHMLPGSIGDFDRGGHFTRVSFRPMPHNMYTSGGQAVRLRGEWPLPPPSFLVDPPHPDSDAGTPLAIPPVASQRVGWSYDGGRQAYLRVDHGRAFIDATTGDQLTAKTVVLMHVPFHDAGWVEDSLGSQSIWYDMLGTGPAEIYSDGRVIHATWHMGTSAGQPYFDNHTPVWFGDEAGRPVILNTGLTWVHVLGNGQAG